MSILSDITISELCGVDLDKLEESIDARMEAHAIRELRWRLEKIKGNKNKPMIDPFFPESVKEINWEKPIDGTTCVEFGTKKIASFGLSSGGYDIRAAAEFKVFKGAGYGSLLDYKNIDESLFDYVEKDEIIIPPNGFILARSIEYIRVPRDIQVVCLGKSTLARAGINCLVTPLEPGWEGHITLEFGNTTTLPNKFYANEGCVQLVFHPLDRPCKTSYADRDGKYQGQDAKIILPRV